MRLRSLQEHFPLLALGIVLILGGYLVGRMTTGLWWLLSGSDVLSITTTGAAQEEDGVPVVHIEEVRGGRVVGSLQGPVRLFLGDTLVTPTEDGSFAQSSQVFAENVIEVLVPQGMHFVASERGTRYYPIGSSQGERIAVQNRVYFATAKEAEGAGYQGP